VNGIYCEHVGVAWDVGDGVDVDVGVSIGFRLHLEERLHSWLALNRQSSSVR